MYAVDGWRGEYRNVGNLDVGIQRIPECRNTVNTGGGVNTGMYTYTCTHTIPPNDETKMDKTHIMLQTGRSTKTNRAELPESSRPIAPEYVYIYIYTYTYIHLP